MSEHGYSIESLENVAGATTTSFLESLENGIVNSRKNIQVLEDAIDKERQTIKEYRIMMDDIEMADKLKHAAENNVHIELVSE